MDLGDFGAMPVELIEEIFSYLSWDDLCSCSKVAESLRPLALSVRNKYAQSHCERQFGTRTSHEAKRKCKLPWHELYNSLSLWPHINSAGMNIKASEPLEIRYYTGWNDQIKRLQILEGGVIGYAHSVEYHKDNTHSIVEDTTWLPNSNAVIYYDSATLEEIRIHKCVFNFVCFEENDHMMVFKELKGYDNNGGRSVLLHVHSKKSNKKYEVTMCEHFSFEPDKSNFFLVQKTLFYISDHKLRMAKEVIENGESRMDVSTLESCELFKRILTIAHVNDNQVYILTYDGRIFSVIDKTVEFQRKVLIKNTDRSKAVNTLTEYGFNWSEHAVYQWIGAPEYRSGKWVGLTHLKRATVFSYGKVVIIGTCHRTLHIYINAYKDGLLRICHKRPTYNIDLRQYEACHVYENERMVTHHKKIMQIDVIEIKNGHRIIMLHCQKIVIVELTHYQRRQDN